MSHDKKLDELKREIDVLDGRFDIQSNLHRASAKAALYVEMEGDQNRPYSLTATAFLQTLPRSESLLNTQKARKLRGKRPLARAIEILHPVSPEDLLEKFEDDDLMYGLYHSEAECYISDYDGPIDIYDVSVDRENGTVTYRERGKSKDKTVQFESLRQYVRKLTG